MNTTARRKSLRAVALLFTIVISLLAMSAAPAGAGTSFPPAPGPSDGRTGGPGDNGKNAGTNCTPTDPGSTSWPYRTGLRGNQVVYSVYMSCGDGWMSNWRWVSWFLDCTTSFDVWRFYGTEAAPVQSWTVSRAVQQDACADAPRSLMVTVPHPDDELLGWAPAGWPFRAQWQDPWSTGRSINNSMPFSATAIPLGALTTTSWSFAHGGKACYELSTPDSVLGKYFLGRDGRKGDKFDTESGRQVRKAFRQMYDRNVSAWGPDWAKTMLNATSIGSDPNGDDIIYGDGRACSSDLDFYTELPQGQTTISPDQQKVVGACWIPIRRTMQGFARYSWADPYGSARSNDIVDVFYTDTWGYPQYYAPSANAPRSRNGNVERAFAYVAALEVGGRSPYANPDPAPPSSGPLPSPASPVPWMTPAEIVATYADCGYLKGAVGMDAKEETKRTDWPTDVRVDVTVPEVGQVGGTLRPATLQTKLVVPTTTKDGPWVDSVPEWNVRVNAPAGFPSNLWSAGTWSGSNATGSMPLSFLRTTAPGERFSVSVSGTVRLRGVSRVSTTLMLPCSIVNGNAANLIIADPGMSQLCSINGQARDEVEYRNVPIRPVYSPGQTFPVIGAAEQPAGRNGN